MAARKRKPDWIDNWISEASRYARMNQEQMAETIRQGEYLVLCAGKGWLRTSATDALVDETFHEDYERASTPQKKLDVIRTFELFYADMKQSSLWYKSVESKIKALKHFANREKTRRRLSAHRTLTKREKVIRKAIRQDLSGKRYFAFLDMKGLATEEKWQKHKDNPCPPRHAQAYEDPYWRGIIQKEKSRVATRVNSERTAKRV